MELNYGLILSTRGCAGLVEPVLMARAKDVTGSFAGMLPLVAALLLVSVMRPFLTAKPGAGPAWGPALSCGGRARVGVRQARNGGSTARGSSRFSGGEYACCCGFRICSSSFVRPW